jgi:hypothetical protein
MRRFVDRNRLRNLTPLESLWLDATRNPHNYPPRPIPTCVLSQSCSLSLRP